MRYNFIFILVMLLSGIISNAQDTFLDSTFGNNGIVTAEYFYTHTMAVQDDGKILVAGSKLNNSSDPIILRFNPDGSPDTTFGTGGKVQLDLPQTEYFTDIAQLPNGQILAMGIRYTSGGGVVPGTSKIMFMRFSESGITDTTLGNEGILLTGFGTARSDVRKMILLPDGKILVSGSIPPEGMGTPRPALARFNADFTPDTSFNGTGYKVMTSSIGGFNTMDIDEEGRVVTIISINGATASVFRFMANGQPDNSFGTNGVAAVMHGGAQCYPGEIEAAADGKILICGSLKNGIHSAFTLRLLPNGTLDPTFGTAGVFKLENTSGQDEATVRIVQLPNGKIINGLKRYTTSFDYGLAFISANGTLDTSLGTQGQVVTAIENDQYLYSMVQQPDGKVLAVGFDNANIVLVRYDVGDALGQPVPDMKKFSVYPNPASDRIIITGLPDETSIAVYNTSGQKLMEVVSNEDTVINISSLANGIYLLNTVHGAAKIIKQ